MAAFVMMFCAGVRPKYLLLTIGARLLLVIGAILIRPFRMHAFMLSLTLGLFSGDWQACPILNGFGIRGLTGVGLGEGGSQMVCCQPVIQTLFSRSSVKSLAFIGAVLVVLLIAFIVWRGIMIAVKSSGYVYLFAGVRTYQFNCYSVDHHI